MHTLQLKHVIRFLLLTYLSLLVLPAQAQAQAQDETVADSPLSKILETLRDNQAITSAQYNELLKEIQPESSRSTQPSPETISQSQERVSPPVAKPDVSLKLGGQLSIDAAAYKVDKTAMGNGTQLRRARLSAEGKLFTDWSYAMEYDLAGNEAAIKDAYIAYKVNKRATFSFGHFKAPFSMGGQTGSKSTLFMERSLPVDTFAPGRRFGLSYHHYGKRWSTNSALFFEGAGDDVDKEGNEGWGISSRLTHVAPSSQSSILHIGASIAYEKTNDEAALRFKPGPESDLTGATLVDTQQMADIDYHLSYGLEAATLVGPFLLQGEYILTDVHRKNGAPALQFDGWYIQTSFVLTGESKGYKASNGTFKRPKPSGDLGALELGVRLSHINLEDADIQGGKEQNLTVGLNWYPNPNLRLMTNYIQAIASPNEDGVKDSPEILQMRAQLNF